MPKRRAVTLTALQPLTLGAQPSAGTALVRTHRHIPGTVLRGALAQVWIAGHDRPAILDSSAPHLLKRFMELFERHVRYGTLLPDGWSLVPLSVRRCKYRAAAGCARWYADEAFDSAVGASRPILDECAECGGPAELSKGQVESFSESTETLLRQSTHVELTEGGVAAEGQLFSREAIRPRDATRQARLFRGHLVLPDDLSERAHEWISATRRVRVGGRRSTSGLAEVSSSPEEGSGMATSERVVMRFTSPAFLTDDGGLPLLHPSQRELATLLGTDLRIEGSWVRHERIGGWNAAANLPKPKELAVSAGSSYLLHCAEPPAPERLAALRDSGLGLRRNEGFGMLHLDTAPWSGPPNGPHPAEEGTTTSTGEESLALAERFNATGHGPWLYSNLTAYVRERGAGGPPSTEMLRATTLRDLRPSDRVALERLLLDPAPDRAREVIRHLNFLIRARPYT